LFLLIAREIGIQYSLNSNCDCRSVISKSQRWRGWILLEQSPHNSEERMKICTRFSIARLVVLSIIAMFILVGCGTTSTNARSEVPSTSLFQACDVDDGMSCKSRPRSASHFLVKSSYEPSEQGYCCKVCSVGKACGDSCISRDKVCHKPSGCACDK